MSTTDSVTAKLQLSHTAENKTKVSNNVLLTGSKHRISEKQIAVEKSSDNRNGESGEENIGKSPRSDTETQDGGKLSENGISPRSEYDKNDAEQILSKARELVSRRRFRCSPKPNMLERICNTVDTETCKLPARCSRVRPFTANPTFKRQHAIRPMTAAAATRDLLCRARSGRKRGQTDDQIRPLSTFSELVSVTPAQRNRSYSAERRLTLEIDWLVKKRQLMQQQRDAAMQLQEDDEEEISEEERQSRRQNRHQRMLKLIWWFKVIKAVIGLALDMRKLSMEKTESSFLTQAYYMGAKPATVEEISLFFDKREFSRNRSAKVPLWAQELAVLPPEDRSEEEVVKLEKFMMRMRTFKDKFDENTRRIIARNAIYTNCDTGRVILRQGQWGVDYYFIFSGAVYVQIEVTDPKTKKITLNTIGEVRTGETFGELALLGDGKRTATILCKEATELFQIDREIFLSVCPQIFNAELVEKISFASRFEVFKDWERESIRQLCFKSKIMYVPQKHLVERDWTLSRDIYFVMQGRIALIREFDILEVLEKTDMRLSVMNDKPLEIPNIWKADLGGADDSRRLACVGIIREGQHSEIAILGDAVVPSVAMVSEGVKFMRVTVRDIRDLAPKSFWDVYLKKKYKPRHIPPDEDLCMKYIRDVNWLEYKQKVIQSILQEQKGPGITMVPATTKGTSGWTRWPGYSYATRKQAVLLYNNVPTPTEHVIMPVPPPSIPVRRRPTNKEQAFDDDDSIYDVTVTTALQIPVPVLVKNDRSMSRVPQRPRVVLRVT